MVSNCPDCDQPIDEHFTFAMSSEETNAWLDNELVCARFRSELELMKTV